MQMLRMSARPRRRRFVALASLAVILCAACGNSQSSQAKTGNRTLIVDQNFSYDDLDPARGALTTAIVVDKSVYDTLMHINPNDLSKPYPSLATSFTVSPDAKTTTFLLRQGVKFASGNPFTSADVVWSLTRLNVLGLGFGQNYPMNGLTVTAPDPYTVVFTSTAPNPAIPITMTVMNTGILDSVLVKQHGGTNDAKDKADDFLNSGSAGSGPYMIQSIDRTSQIVLKANPNYWGPKPAYSTIIVRDAPPATQAFDIQDGQAQLALDISSEAVTSLNASSVKVISAPSSDQLYLIMNASPSVLPWAADQNFRDAVHYGLDYQGLVALAGKGAVQMIGFVPAGLLGSLPAADAPQRDVARAQAALARVGAVNPTITLEFPADRSLDGLVFGPIATKIQSDLKEVGITVNLLGEPHAVSDARFAAGKIQLYLAFNNADYPDVADFTYFDLVVPNGDAESAHWVQGMDPAIDALTAAALAATQPADRNAAYQALEKAMTAKAYFDFILQPGKNIVAAKSVQATVNPFTQVDFGSVS